jgi:hypothetical protein
MKPWRPRIIRTIFGLTILGLALLLAWRSTTVEASPLCGPPGGRSLFVRGGLRIFSGGGSRSGTFVCDGASQTQVTLGKGSVEAPFSVASSWAAGMEARAEGQDTTSVNVMAADARSREHLTCRIGVANRPGQLPRVSRLWAAPDGEVAISAQVPLNEGPELAVCSGSGLKIFASGPEFVPAPVELQGQTLSWSQGGQRHSVQI